MLSSVANYLKLVCTSVGERLPDRYLAKIQLAADHLMVGAWMRNHGFEFPPRGDRREEVWAPVVARVRDRHVAYLEFGVFRGESMRYWSRELKNPRTSLHGFDSFTGLPEDGGVWHKSQFDTDGCTPKIDDARVRFFKGWFNEVLPTYTVPEHDVLVLNLDADLYSSTIYVLRHLRPHIKPGTFLYFDEINHLHHEARAFDEFMSESGLKFRAIAADKTLSFAAFECIA